MRSRRRIRTCSTCCCRCSDDGRLTDGQGRTVDFRNTVVIMTSNLGSQVIQELAGEANYPKMKAAVHAGRDASISAPNSSIGSMRSSCSIRSTGHEIRAIVDIQLGRLRQRLAERDIELRLDDDARDKIGEAGFDTVYGARPLKRAIQAQIENPLAQQILRGDFGAGRPASSASSNAPSWCSRRSGCTEAAAAKRGSLYSSAGPGGFRVRQRAKG